MMIVMLLPMLPVQTLHGEEAADGSRGKGIRVVKSLFDHRRQDVREAAARERAEREAAEEAERPSFTGDALKVEAGKQRKVLETLLLVRMPSDCKFEAGAKVNVVIRAMAERAGENAEPIEITWEEDASENEKIALGVDVVLSGCNLAEALRRICAAADCQYILKGSRILLESIADKQETIIRSYHSEIVHKCFKGEYEYCYADGRRSRKYVRRKKPEEVFVIKGKKSGQGLRHGIKGEYYNHKGLLTLTGAPHDLCLCKQELETLYAQWLGGSSARRYEAEDPKGKRFRMEQKLDSVPAVPIEFPRTATVGDVIRYFTTICRYARLKSNIRFAADRADLKSGLSKPLRIQNCTILEALFSACEAMQGAYTIRHPKVTFTPGVLESRSYPVHTEFIELLRKIQSPGRPESNATIRHPYAISDVTKQQLREALLSLGVPLPSNAEVSYDAEQYKLTVHANPRTIQQLNRLIYYTNVEENP